jgi:hypothetical protein
MTSGITEWLVPNYSLTWEATKVTLSILPLHFQSFQPNIIICGVVNIPECLAIAQKLNIQVFIGSTIPLYPSSEIPIVTALSEPLSIGLMNRFSHWAAYKAQWLLLGKHVNQFRSTVLGLPTVWGNDFQHLVCLGGFSESVQPIPLDYPAWVLSNASHTDLQY